MHAYLHGPLPTAAAQTRSHRSHCPPPPPPHPCPGTITAEELREALKQKGSLMKAEELEGLLKLIDQDESGCIDYEVGVGWGFGAKPVLR